MDSENHKMGHFNQADFLLRVEVLFFEYEQYNLTLPPYNNLLSYMYILRMKKLRPQYCSNKRTIKSQINFTKTKN